MRNILVIAFFVIFLSLEGFSKGGNFIGSTLQTNFTKVFKSRVTGKEVESKGEIIYKYPSKIKITAPDKSVFVSNGSKTWKYDPPFIEGEKGEVVIGLAKQYDLLALLDSLKNGLTSNKLYKVSLDRNKATLTMTTSGQSKLGVKRVDLQSNKSSLESFDQVKEMELTDNKDIKTLFRFKQVLSNKTISDDSFIFNVPKNTNITHLK